MTKVEAILKVLKDNNGVATWGIIYSQIIKYYPEARSSEEWKAGIRGVLYREIKHNKHFKMIDSGLVGTIDFDERNLTLQADRGRLTENNLWTIIRIGQERFRANLLKSLKFCPITNISDFRLLNSSHIKPWAISSDTERLDVFNGFIFSPMIDQLFDKGLITFDASKRMLISPTLSPKNVERVGIINGRTYKLLPMEGRESYLSFHRESIFIEH